jgi:hypothetical protein
MRGHEAENCSKRSNRFNRCAPFKTFDEGRFHTFQRFQWFSRSIASFDTPGGTQDRTLRSNRYATGEGLLIVSSV